MPCSIYVVEVGSFIGGVAREGDALLAHGGGAGAGRFAAAQLQECTLGHLLVPGHLLYDLFLASQLVFAEGKPSFFEEGFDFIDESHDVVDQDHVRESNRARDLVLAW